MAVTFAFLLRYFNILNYSLRLLQSQGYIPPDWTGSGKRMARTVMSAVLVEKNVTPSND